MIPPHLEEDSRAATRRQSPPTEEGSMALDPENQLLDAEAFSAAVCPETRGARGLRRTTGS